MVSVTICNEVVFTAGGCSRRDLENKTNDEVIVKKCTYKNGTEIQVKEKNIPIDGKCELMCADNQTTISNSTQSVQKCTECESDDADDCKDGPVWKGKDNKTFNFTLLDGICDIEIEVVFLEQEIGKLASAVSIHSIFTQMESSPSIRTSKKRRQRLLRKIFQ
jgi:hypothetical protein